MTPTDCAAFLDQWEAAGRTKTELCAAMGISRTQPARWTAYGAPAYIALALARLAEGKPGWNPTAGPPPNPTRGDKALRRRGRPPKARAIAPSV